MDERPAGRKLFEYLKAHPHQVKAVFFDDITRMDRIPDSNCYGHRLYEFHSKFHGVAFFVSGKQRSDSPQISDFLVCILKGLENGDLAPRAEAGLEKENGL